MINVSKKSLDLLRQCLNLHNPNLISCIDDSNFIFNQESYNVLREAVCDELITNGFVDDIPTEYGLQLESLIDELGRLFITA